MTKADLKVKINELTNWLTKNEGHPDYAIILKDKIELERKLSDYGI
ncbi:hypothetical protein [Flavobacterium sp. HSC-61S13]|nr:hypothetical protein [Flavobacterium sp. HSC-61S13]MCP1997275.1 hypothetical protein [Flavobacterium sp. HSC-61S13]